MSGPLLISKELTAGVDGWARDMVQNVPECPETPPHPPAAGCAFSERHVSCWGPVGSRPSASGQRSCLGCGVSLRAASALRCRSGGPPRATTAAPRPSSQRVGQGASRKQKPPRSAAEGTEDTARTARGGRRPRSSASVRRDRETLAPVPGARDPMPSVSPAIRRSLRLLSSVEFK